MPVGNKKSSFVSFVGDLREEPRVSSRVRNLMVSEGRARVILRSGGRGAATFFLVAFAGFFLAVAAGMGRG